MKPVTLARSGAEIAGGMHAAVAPLAEVCFNAIKARGYLLHPGSCWGAECRQISATNRASNHSWGLAADLNAPTNPYTSTGEHDIPDWAYDLLRAYGWGLGADYNGKKTTCTWSGWHTIRRGRHAVAGDQEWANQLAGINHTYPGSSDLVGVLA
jgi:hypothetical protein